MFSALVERGFTLLEMVVAVAVLGLLSVFIARGLALGSSAFTRARAADAALWELRARDRILRDLLAGAMPEFASADTRDRRILFDGDAAGLRFVTRLPSVLGSPVPIVARLAEDGGQLVLDWHLDLPASNDGVLPWKRYVIARAADGLRFSYAGTGGTWQEAWRNGEALPAKIALSMDGAAPLVVAMRVDASPACFYAPTDLACAR